MRSYVPAYAVDVATTLDEALRRLSGEPGVWTPLAGGTDIMVLFEAGELKQRKFLSLWHLQELRGIHVSPTHIELGALTTYTDVQRHPALMQEFPGLCQAGAETGGIAIQNRGTLGGNIANASPAADSPPALLVADAEVELTSTAGSRWVSYATFHTGYKRHVMKPEELLTKVRLPRRKTPQTHYYRKVGTRLAQAISKVVLAGRAEVKGVTLTDVRLAIGSVGPVTLRLPKTEAALVGKPLTPAVIDRAVQALGAEITPIDDIRSTADFRRDVAQNLLRQFAARAQGRA